MRDRARIHDISQPEALHETKQRAKEVVMELNNLLSPRFRATCFGAADGDAASMILDAVNN